MILVFTYGSDLWEVIPSSPEGLIIRASRVSGGRVTLRRLSSEGLFSDFLVTPLREGESPYKSAHLLVNNSPRSTTITLDPPSNGLPWSVTVQDQALIQLPDYNPSWNP